MGFAGWVGLRWGEDVWAEHDAGGWGFGGWVGLSMMQVLKDWVYGVAEVQCGRVVGRK